MVRPAGDDGLTLGVDMALFQRTMKGFERNIPFAVSLSLNRSAEDALKHLRATADQDLTVRTPWILRGMRFRRSTKKDLTVAVGSVDDFMRGQVLGSARRDNPTAAKPAEAIPMVGRGRPRSQKKSVTRPARWPGALAERPNTFIGTVDTKVGPMEGVWERLLKKKNRRRTGARKHARKRKLKSVRLLYLLKWKVDLKPKWKLLERVQETFAARWQGHALQAIQQAIDTSYEKAKTKG